MLMFTGFVLYGFVYPVYTRLGCCGHFKSDPDEETGGLTNTAYF